MSTPDSMPDGQNSHWHILPWFNLLLLLALVAWTGLLSYYSWDSQNDRKNEIAGVSKKIDAIPESPDLEKERKEIMEQVSKMVADVSKSSKERDGKLEDGISKLASENEEFETFVKEQNERVMEEINTMKSSRISSGKEINSSSPNEEYSKCNLAEASLIGNLIDNFFRANIKGDSSGLAEVYADSVHYCYKKGGRSTKDYIINEVKEFWKKWPIRYYKIIDMGFAKDKKGGYYARLDVDFDYSNGDKTISGRVKYGMVFEYIKGQGFRMTYFDEEVKTNKSKSSKAKNASNEWIF